MNYSNRTIAGIGLLVILIGSVAAAIFYMNIGSPNLDIEFIPNEINTAPGEVGWFIVAIETNVQTTAYDVSIQTNTSIESNYTFWPEAPLLEVFLYPNSSHIDSCIEVEVSLSSGELVSHDTAILNVLNWTFEQLPAVLEKRDVFINFLSANFPELDITATTPWTPIYNGAGILIVGHYLFKSSEWEMEISWHVMIQPHDWVQVYLRNRAELQPSWAGKIESWGSDNHSVVEIDPPDEIYRAR
ncbi:MAG: hypothetical protein ACFFAY_08900 [Promethearchaeota archaeon]